MEGKSDYQRRTRDECLKRGFPTKRGRGRDVFEFTDQTNNDGLVQLWNQLGNGKMDQVEVYC